MYVIMAYFERTLELWEFLILDSRLLVSTSIIVNYSTLQTFKAILAELIVSQNISTVYVHLHKYVCEKSIIELQCWNDH